MAGRKTVFIVCSPRQRVGKTLIARVLTEFVLAQGRAADAFDLNPNNTALTGFLPHIAAPADLSGTRAQMALFDALIADDDVTKIVDLGDEMFEQFFTLAHQIAFEDEAARRGIVTVLLFVADPDPRSTASYGEVWRGFPRTMLVPVHNEQIGQLQDYIENFPNPARGEPPLRIPVLSPFLKSIVEKPGFSFDGYRERKSGMRTELHEWIERVFVEFRQLELRLLLRDLKSSLALR